MPGLPAAPGVYVWASSGMALYVGQTTGTLRARLGSNGYSTISTYNTLARPARGRSNGGQQTNCRINALANDLLRNRAGLEIWYRVVPAQEARNAEAQFMLTFGLPSWNREDRRG